MFIQQSYIAVKLSYVSRVHLQIRTFLNEDISQSLMIRPAVVRETPRNKIEKFRNFYYNLDFLKRSINAIQLLNTLILLHPFLNFLSCIHKTYMLLKHKNDMKLIRNTFSFHIVYVCYQWATLSSSSFSRSLLSS